jgi:hypothetical protein
VPFALLLSRDLKRKPARSELVAAGPCWSTCSTVYWLVMPTWTRTSATFSIWICPLAWGMGGLAVAFASGRFAGTTPLPGQGSLPRRLLRYRQPT